MSGEGRADAETVEAKKAAVRLLAHRARPRSYLEERLRKRGFAAAAIQSALDALAAAGYVNDRQYARDRIEGLLEKSLQWGPALVHRLMADGMDPELAEEAVAERLAGEDQRQWALQVARERTETTDNENREAERRRLGAYLSRRGFDTEVIVTIVEEVLSEAQ